MSEVKIVFLQKYHEGLSPGTPLEETEKTTAHHQADAMLGGVVHPSKYYKVYGGDGKTVYRIPSFKMLVGENHPTSKEEVGPFSVGEVTVTHDRLPPTQLAKVSYSKKWPHLVINVCINTHLSEEGGSVAYPDVHINLTSGDMGVIRKLVSKAITESI